jgi:hypothetical protein
LRHCEKTMSTNGKEKANSHPLDAVPVIPEEVEHAVDNRSQVQIRRPRPQPEGWRGCLTRRMRFRGDFRLNLDERGSFFWNQIDGRRSLREIALQLRQEYSLGDEESWDTTVKFTQTLMLRGVICLMVPGSTQHDLGDPITGARNQEVNRGG